MRKHLLFIPLLLSFAGAAGAENEQEQLQEIQGRIKSQKEKLDATGRTERTTLGELESIGRELGKVETDLASYRKSLNETNARIALLKSEIAAAEAKLGKRKQWLKKKLRAVHKYGRYGEIALLVESSENLSEFARRWRYLEAVASYERETIEGFRKDLSALREKQTDLDRLYGKLKVEEEKVMRAEQGLAGRKKQKETVLASVKREKAGYERMLAELKDAQRRLLEIIRESEGKRYEGDGFRNLKGRLLWPVDGRVAIPYGSQKDPEYNTPIFRNGIYIEAPAGSVARSVDDGKVVYADWFKGYGRLVVVNHGNGYHSLYANLAEIFLKTGDIIKKKAGVGRLGESGLLNKPALYFEIRYKGKPLNPMQWLTGG